MVLICQQLFTNILAMKNSKQFCDCKKNIEDYNQKKHLAKNAKCFFENSFVISKFL